MANLKEKEEAKRDSHWDPLTKWNLLQETIAWAEAQSTVKRNTRENRLAEQARKRSSGRTSLSPHN